MNEQADIQKLVPKLRFPEFSGEWDEKILAKISPVIFDGTHQTPKYTNEGVPFFSVENIVSGNKNKFISQKDHILSTSKNKPEKNDILLTRIGKIGFSTIISWNYEFSIYVTLAVIKKSKLFNSYFLHSFFQSAYYQNEILSKSLLSAVPCKINMNELRQTKVLLPFTIQEQQKIADCLSSLDDLISTQTQKLTALAQHKKGLMQNLFPAQGKTTPKLRFPEFENTKKWGHSMLGEHCSITTGRLDANAMVKNGKYRFYTCAKDYYLINEYAFDTEALLVSGNGANVGYIHYYKGRFNAYQRTYVLNEFSETIYFIKYFLDKNLHQRISIEKKDGNTPYIIMSTLTDMGIQLPKLQEQQQIADCLSSLDDLINTQTQKLTALAQHKKGLMQNLFPNNETNL